MIRVKKRMIAYLEEYRPVRGTKSDWHYVKAHVGDKIIIKHKGKCISGELVQVGDKYIHLRVAPNRYCGTTTYFYHKKFLISELETYSIYPKGYQELGTEKLVRKRWDK